MPKTTSDRDPSGLTPSHRHGVRWLGALALAGALAGCNSIHMHPGSVAEFASTPSSLGTSGLAGANRTPYTTQLLTSSAPVGGAATATAPDRSGKPTPFTTHLLPLAANGSFPPPPPSQPATGVFLYPWRVAPVEGSPVAAAPVAPQVTAPPPMASTSVAAMPPVATVEAPPTPRKTKAPKPHRHRAAKPPRARAATRPPRRVTAPRRVPKARPPVARKTTPPSTSASTVRPGNRLPVDCPHLWRTNPYLAGQLRCPPATSPAPASGADVNQPPSAAARGF